MGQYIKLKLFLPGASVFKGMALKFLESPLTRDLTQSLHHCNIEQF